MSMIINETVNHAIDYILQHINEEVSVDDVAAHCHFSKYYFSRMFKEENGTGYLYAAETVRHMRKSKNSEVYI